jgi:hypothetical protein
MHDNLHYLIDFINVELKKLASWFKANKLVLNTSKTKYMIFRTKNRNINLQGKNVVFDFNYNDNASTYDNDKVIVLQRVHNNGDPDNQTYKLLGVLFDEYLTFNQHLQYVQSKISRSLYLLNRSKNFLSKTALRMLYFATVHSHLNYCPFILSIASKSQINKLFILQKKAIRIVTSSAYHAHTALLFYECNILPVNYLIDYAKLNFMHSSFTLPPAFTHSPPSLHRVWTPADSSSRDIYQLSTQQLLTYAPYCDSDFA